MFTKYRKVIVLYDIMNITKSWKRRRRVHWQDYWKLRCGCAICGYRKHPKALSFHHIDKLTKHPLIKNGACKTRAGGMWHLTDPKNASIRELIQEWRKCRILCMNCHMEDEHQNYYNSNIHNLNMPNDSLITNDE